ncbi:MAG: tyrosine-type recombinase/integrase [Scytonema sp. PMC 1069.18]|nr:tyrosine-type recombinase/integrase [Scytonema sp. PMC 1069.18]
MFEASKLAKLGKVHPHQLRHSCGYYLGNLGANTRDVQDYLGHKNITKKGRGQEAEGIREFCLLPS